MSDTLPSIKYPISIGGPIPTILDSDGHCILGGRFGHWHHVQSRLMLLEIVAKANALATIRDPEAEIARLRAVEAAANNFRGATGAYLYQFTEGGDCSEGQDKTFYAADKILGDLLAGATAQPGAGEAGS